MNYFVHIRNLGLSIYFVPPWFGIIQKTYYTNYQDVLYTKMPFTITEINYRAEGDSSISRKTYSNLKLNGNVTDYWLNYKIPENAEVIVQSNGNSTFQD